MRVLIDATPLLLRSAGVKNYFYHWLTHLRRAAGEDTIGTFPAIGRLGPLNHDGSVLPAAATWSRLALLFFVNLPRNPALEWILPPADIFHATNQVRNPPRRMRLTATLHDLTCWIMPEVHQPTNVLADRIFAERVLQKAARILAVSGSSRDDAVRILGIRPDAIEVMYPGIPDSFFETPPARLATGTARQGVERPYVLFVGTIEPRKNVETLLDAWAQLPAGYRGEFDLVLAGSAGWQAGNTLRRLRSGLAGVHYLGYVPEADLPALTAGAAVFAYPSLYEGFGFPVAQAMACGVPVVTSNISSLPEVAGESALLVDPRSPAELAAALGRLLGSPSLRAALGAAGAARARAEFRWEKYAARSLEFFRRAMGS